MKVLVTGGAGFIGSNLVRLLVCEKGIEVINLDKRVVNFSGKATFMQYRARFSEEIISTTEPVASKIAPATAIFNERAAFCMGI